MLISLKGWWIHRHYRLSCLIYPNVVTICLSEFLSPPNISGSSKHVLMYILKYVSFYIKSVFVTAHLCLTAFLLFVYINLRMLYVFPLTLLANNLRRRVEGLKLRNQQSMSPILLLLKFSSFVYRVV